MTSQGTPTVILSMDQDSPLDMSSLPPAVRRRMKLRSASASPSTSPPLVNNKPSSATASPVTSPPDSTPSSPRNSPRSSPTFKRRGIQKLLFKKKRVRDLLDQNVKYFRLILYDYCIMTLHCSVESLFYKYSTRAKSHVASSIQSTTNLLAIKRP